MNGLIESEHLAAELFLKKGQNKCGVQYGHPNVQLGGRARPQLGRGGHIPVPPAAPLLLHIMSSVSPSCHLSHPFQPFSRFLESHHMA